MHAVNLRQLLPSAASTHWRPGCRQSTQATHRHALSLVIETVIVFALHTFQSLRFTPCAAVPSSFALRMWREHRGLHTWSSHTAHQPTCPHLTRPPAHLLSQHCLALHSSHARAHLDAAAVHQRIPLLAFRALALVVACHASGSHGVVLALHHGSRHSTRRGASAGSVQGRFGGAHQIPTVCRCEQVRSVVSPPVASQVSSPASSAALAPMHAQLGTQPLPAPRTLVQTPAAFL